MKNPGNYCEKKMCNKCKTLKRLDEFYSNNPRKREGYYFSSCEKCREIKLKSFKMVQAEYNKAYRKKNTLRFNGLYERWHSMKGRCYAQKNYLKNNIKVCSEWANSFEAFRIWAIANGYKPELTIDRINGKGDYEPSNCRFVSMSINIRNSSATKLNCFQVRVIKRLLEFGVLTYKEIGNFFGVCLSNISAIANGYSWVKT